MKQALIAFLIAWSAVLGGCGSPTDAVSFQPPEGWRSAISVGPFMQAWDNPQNSREVLMIMKFPVAMDLNKALDSANVKNMKTQRQETISICGNQQALYVSATGTSAKSGQTKDEILMTTIGGTTYMTLYARPLGAPANAQAEAALKNVCEKK